MCTVFIFLQNFGARIVHSRKSSYCAAIMLNAFANLLCSKLCWHNWRKPTNEIATFSAKKVYSETLIALVEGVDHHNTFYIMLYLQSNQRSL